MEDEELEFIDRNRYKPKIHPTIPTSLDEFIETGYRVVQTPDEVIIY